ncbi:MAG: DUF2723 domain-containing protein [Candidatus Altiarchaeota archaeon]
MSRKGNRWGGVTPGLIVFTTTLVVYLSTVSTNVGRGDTGEFQTLPYVFGIAHPTGYPTYILLGSVFRWIPLGSYAYRINLMSAFFGSVTAYLLYRIVMKYAENVYAASAAALTLAFSKLYWSQSVIAEAYILNAFFLVSCLLLLLEWRDGGDNRLLYAFSILYGIGLGNHMSLALYAPAYAFIILRRDWRVLLDGRLLKMFALFAIGASVYAYILIRDNPGTPMNYIHEFSVEHGTFNYSENAVKDRFERLGWMVKGRQFNADELTYKRLTSTMEEQRLRESWGRIMEQITVFGAILCIIGVSRLFMKDKPMLAATIIFFTLNTMRFGGGMYEHSIPSVIICCIWIGFGVEQTSEYVRQRVLV